MWHAYDRRYLVGDRVLYEHKARDATECKVVPAVVCSVTPSSLRLTLDTDSSICGCWQITIQGDLKKCKPIRRFVFAGDVVRFFEQSEVLVGIVRRELEPFLEGLGIVLIQLMHQSGYVYRSIGDLQFSFEVLTGSTIPGNPGLFE